MLTQSGMLLSQTFVMGTKVHTSNIRKYLEEKRSLEATYFTYIKKLIKIKHRLWTRFCETKSAEIERKFKLTRNAVKNDTRKAAQSGMQSVAKPCKENPKKFWKFVKSKTDVF